MASQAPRTPGELPAASVADLHERQDAERALVAAVVRRDRKAAAEFVAAHVDAIHGYVRHRLSSRTDRVDDLVQDVFLAALAGLHGFRGTSTLRSWLLGIARHKVEDFYRQRLRDPDPLDDSPEWRPASGDDSSIEERIDRDRAAEQTQLILRMLPETYSIALLWRYWEGRAVRDIATATGRTEKAVERLLARARDRFRELWKQVNHD